MSLDIVGAGLAGLLAGRMLHHKDPILHEAQASLPNNHSAVLRFRSTVVGDTLGIQFKKVNLIKDSLPWRNTIASALAYSEKNLGKFRSDRSIIAGITQSERYIAPADLIQRMARGLNIKYGKAYEFGREKVCVSTIPMPTLMTLLDYPNKDQINFNGVPGINIKARIPNCDAYVSLLVPHPDLAYSRISITGDELIVEVPNVEELNDPRSVLSSAAHHLGIKPSVLTDITHHTTRYAKISPIDEMARKDFIYWATDQHGIFSLGRFATWRPGLLLDDLVRDIRLIDGWLDRADRYAVSRHRR